MLEIRLIEWLDSAHNEGWVSKKDDTLRPDPIVSVGFVVQETKEFVTIAQGEGSDTYSDKTCIPKFAVTKMTTLRKAR